MPTNEYMTPEIGSVVAMLTQSCNDLTRQDLIRGITAKTQEWVQGDPELADILLENNKTLEGCVRYVTEKAAFVISPRISPQCGKPTLKSSHARRFRARTPRWPEAPSTRLWTSMMYHNIISKQGISHGSCGCLCL